jgi:hypothetical protein
MEHLEAAILDIVGEHYMEGGSGNDLPVYVHSSRVLEDNLCRDVSKVMVDNELNF